MILEVLISMQIICLSEQLSATFMMNVWNPHGIALILSSPSKDAYLLIGHDWCVEYMSDFSTSNDEIFSLEYDSYFS